MPPQRPARPASLGTLARLCWVLALAWPLATPTATGATNKTSTSTSTSKPPASKSAPQKKPAAKSPPKSTAPARPSGIARNPYLGAIVVDAASGRVLFEDGADTRAYPASVLKLMDLLLVMEQIKAGRLKPADPVPVSARAATTGGSQVWLAEKEVFTVEDLLFALMIQSANDAAVALAEKVAGSTTAFVDLMNRRAQELGMTQTRFQSVHGLPPSAGQQPDVTTARDLVLLCRELLKHRETLLITSTRERPFRPQGHPGQVIMRSHNHLLDDVAGCDGLKTGYFTAAGFSVAATAARDGQRVLAVVLGSSDRKTRDARARDLLEKGLATLAASASANPTPQAPPNAATARPSQPPLPPGR